MDRTHGAWKTAFAVLGASLSLVSVSLRLPAGPETALGLAPFTAAWALIAAGLCAGYYALWKRHRPFSRTAFWMLAVFFALVTTLAQSFTAVGTTELLTQGGGARVRACLYFAGRVPLYYLAMALLEAALCRTGPAKAPPVAGLLPLALLLLLCWVPYYCNTFPGVVSNDSITQLLEIHGVKALSAGNPLAQTLLLWFFCLAGRLFGSADTAVALYCIVQALLMALLLAQAVRDILHSGAPRWVGWLSLGFFALCPVFPLFAFCVGKDTNFSMAVLFFSLMIWRILQQPRCAKPSRSLIIGLCLSAVLLLLLRNPGVYLALLALVLLLLYTLFPPPKAPIAKGGLWIAPLCALVAVGLAWAGLQFAVVSGAEAMPETEEYSVPLQQVARIVASAPESLTVAEKDAIAAVLDFDKIKGEYNGELSDPIKNLWNPQATPAQKAAFFRTWRTLLFKHPGTCFSAFFHNTYGYLSPGYVSAIKPTLLIGKQGHTTALDPYFAFSVNPRSPALKAAMDTLMQQPFFRILLAPGLYGWLTLFAFVVLLCSRQKALLLPAVPALFALAGCLLSAVNGYFRYALPLYVCAPLLLALCAAALKRPQKPEEE